MHIFREIQAFFERNRWVEYLGFFLVFGALYGTYQWSASFLDPDSFYHAKMAELMLERGIIRDFTWLPFTTLAEAYADHHFLYHVALMPFAYAFGPLVGSKVAAGLFAAGTVVAFHAAVRAYGVRYAAVFTAIFATSAGVVARTNLAKASAPSIILLLCALVALQRRARWALFIIAWIYVWTHGAWPLLGVIATVILVATMVTDRALSGKWPNVPALDETKNLLAVAAGLLTGLVVNPYFPANLRFYWEQTVQIAVVGYRDRIPVGMEWYPYDLSSFFADAGNIGLVLAGCLGALLAIVFWNDLLRRDAERPGRREVAEGLAFLVLALLFFALMLRSKRHTEYFVPFAAFSLALLSTSLLRRLDFAAVAARVRWLFPKPKIAPTLLAVYLCVCMFAIGFRSLIAVSDILRTYSISWSRYAETTAWIRENVPQDAVVFHSDWDDFPPMFFRDADHRYIAGLDPTFLYRKDPEGWRLWRDVTIGTNPDVGTVAAERFGAAVVVVEKDHTAMLVNAQADARLEFAHEDAEAIVYRVR